MNSINIYASNDTYITNESGHQNYGKMPYLLVGEGYSDGYFYKGVNLALINFSLPSFQVPTEIYKAEMFLNLKDENNGGKVIIELYRILKNYNGNVVTWQNCPELESTGRLIEIDLNEVSGYIAIDITDIVNQWSIGEIVNYGLALVAKNKSGFVTFSSSRDYRKPYLKLEYIQVPMFFTGATGPQGDKGEKGEPGELGPMGLQGCTGTCGCIGATGEKGEVGPIGATGPQGEKGDKGEKGEKGEQGIKGDKGEAGEDGTDGTNGTHGVTGATGPQGEKGDQGVQGIQGPLGVQGGIGETGPTGAIGPQGVAGPQGERGEQGLPGFAGIQGGQGEPGITGATGVTGPIGETGPSGPIGEGGPQGPQGIQGTTGIQGVQGPQGPQGIQGVPGVQGLQGNEGPRGPQGEQGLMGQEGPMGPTGVTGKNGISVTGPMGEMGPTGATGVVPLVNILDGSEIGSIKGLNTYSGYTMGVNSISLGEGTKAVNRNQMVIGAYNSIESSSPTGDVFVIGNGLGDLYRSNAFRITFNGNVSSTQGLITSGADYAEMFEWEDGNPDKEDRVGYFVTLEGDKIRKAYSVDPYILGVVSGNPSIIGDGEGNNWWNMYVKDKWGRTKYDYIEEATMDGVIGKHVAQINPEYDPFMSYTPRTSRHEWAAVGLLGKLLVRDDGSCEINGYCMPNYKGIASPSEKGYRVIKRISDDVILILFK